MFVLANFIGALTIVIQWALTIYLYVIIARAVISWVNPDPYNPIVQFLHRATDPVLYQIRKRVPMMGGVDISPIIAIMIIFFLQAFLVATLGEIAARLGAAANTRPF
ncbi:MAG: YggT family protein [Thermodesulfobacteriota bacterium]